MKFQPLILPLLLWILVGWSVWFFVPNSPFVVGGVVALVTIAMYFSIRIFTHNKLTYIIPGGVFTLLFSSAVSGYSFINLLLIIAIAILVFNLTASSSSQ